MATLQVARLELCHEARPLLHHGGPLVKRDEPCLGQLVVASRRARAGQPRRPDLARLFEVPERAVDLAHVHGTRGDAQLGQLADDAVAVRGATREQRQHEGLHPAVVSTERRPAAMDRNTPGIAVGGNREERRAAHGDRRRLECGIVRGAEVAREGRVIGIAGWIRRLGTHVPGAYGLVRPPAAPTVPAAHPPPAAPAFMVSRCRPGAPSRRPSGRRHPWSRRGR
jgi:hypothetical protein